MSSTPNGQPGRRHPLENSSEQEWSPRSAAVPQGYSPPPQKNWFARHKFLTLLLGLIIIGGIATAAGGGNKDGGDGTSGDTKASAAAATIGKPARDGQFEFTVTKVEKGVKQVGDPAIAQKPQGQYVLVHVDVRNIGKEARSLSDSDQKLFDASSHQFTADSMAAAMMPNNKVLYEQINPGNAVKGVIVFDMPKDAAPTRIELHDSPFSNGVSVALK